MYHFSTITLSSFLLICSSVSVFGYGDSPYDSGNSGAYSGGASGSSYGGAVGAYGGGGGGYGGGQYQNPDNQWIDVGKLDWGPISPVPYWPLPFLPPAWPLFPNRDFAYGYFPFPFTWGFPGYSRGFYGGGHIGRR